MARDFNCGDNAGKGGQSSLAIAILASNLIATDPSMGVPQLASLLKPLVQHFCFGNDLVERPSSPGVVKVWAEASARSLARKARRNMAIARGQLVAEPSSDDAHTTARPLHPKISEAVQAIRDKQAELRASGLSRNTADRHPEVCCLQVNLVAVKNEVGDSDEDISDPPACGPPGDALMTEIRGVIYKFEEAHARLAVRVGALEGKFGEGRVCGAEAWDRGQT